MGTLKPQSTDSNTVISTLAVDGLGSVGCNIWYSEGCGPAQSLLSLTHSLLRLTS